jgi:hypothetical protein
MNESDDRAVIETARAALERSAAVSRPKASGSRFPSAMSGMSSLGPITTPTLETFGRR